MIVTRWGNPIAAVRSLVDDSHVETRICQYEALKNGMWLDIAKQIVLVKMKGQNEVLKKYGLRLLDSYHYSQEVKAVDGDSMVRARNRLMSLEGKYQVNHS